MVPNFWWGQLMRGYYLHIPFCDKKCTYCDFYSIESTQLIDGFVDKLIREIELRANATGKLSIDTIFFGGGTPSLLSAEQVQRLLSTVQRTMAVTADAEITMECNPGTVTLASLNGYKAAGINRLSIGVQSFVQEELDFLTRIHSPDDARVAMRLAREAGFTSVNMDLMFALPPQSLHSLAYNIEEMLKLDPDHISAYSLVYEAGTPLNAQLLKGAVTPHEEELDADMYTMVMTKFTDAGYHQHEVSTFAKPDKACRHNLIYWHGEDYVSVGPSAHGLIDGRRYWNHRSLTSWTEMVKAEQLPEANTEIVDTVKKRSELAFLTLRADGMPVDQFIKEFNVDLRLALQPSLKHWIDGGLMMDSGDALCLTQNGYQLCDEITIRAMDLLDAYCVSNNGL